MAGLGAIAGPFHSGAPLLAGGFLREAERVGPKQAIDEALRWESRLPGFGHVVYPDGDSRFDALKELFDRAAPRRWCDLLDAVLEVAAFRGMPRPNVDLAVAALALAFDMPEDAGQTLFTIARVAGWIAHYLEEIGERPLRYRTRAIYTAR